MPLFKDIMEARTAIAPYVDETPAISSNVLRVMSGHQEVILKCENLQRTGSYHLRGAVYSVIREKEKDLAINNFITYSSGNAGVAVACAAHSFRGTGRVIIPKGTPQLPRIAIKHFQGEYYECEPTLKARQEEVKKLQKQFSGKQGDRVNKAAVINPYSDEDLISGYGTIGTELMEQTSCSLDCVVVPVSGGALLSGVAIAVKNMAPNVAVFGAEAKESEDENIDFKRGEFIQDGKNVTAKNVESPVVPNSTKYIEKYVDGVVRVPEDRIQYAFRYVFERCKLVIDKQSALAVAAVISRPEQLKKYKRVGIVLPGGNLDLKLVPTLAGSKL